LSALPFCNKIGAKRLHGVNQSRISESVAKDYDRLDLLERIINAKKILKRTGNNSNADSILKKISNLEPINENEIREFDLFQIDKKKPEHEEIFVLCKELGLDTMVLERLIKNAIIKSSDDHDTSCESKEQYLQKLAGSGLFNIEPENVVKFNIEALKKNTDLKKSFMDALEEYLLFDYVEKLEYEQYGLNDFYWALDEQNKKYSKSDANDNENHNQENSHNKETNNNGGCGKDDHDHEKNQINDNENHNQEDSHNKEKWDHDFKKIANNPNVTCKSLLSVNLKSGVEMVEKASEGGRLSGYRGTVPNLIEYTINN
jgi:uncharacterized membrane protein